jgi:hypothetical protein
MMKKFAYNVPDHLRSDFNIREAATPHYMGLTAHVDGDLALVTGWNGREYTLESPRGIHRTADIIVSSEDLADESVMDHNAYLAALRTPDSPMRGSAVRVDDEVYSLSSLEYDRATGQWDITASNGEAEMSVLDLYETAEEMGARLAALDNRPTVEETAVDEDRAQRWLDHAREIYEQLKDDPDLDDLERMAVEVFEDFIEAVTNEDVDGYENPRIKAFMDSCDHKSASINKMSFLAPLLMAARPFLARGATALLGSAAGNALGGMMVPGGGQQQMQAPTPAVPYGYGSRQEPDDHELGWDTIITREAAAADEIENLRAQVVAAIKAWANAGGGQGLPMENVSPEDIWWAVYALAVETKNVTSLQTALQATPPEFHNAPIAGMGTDPMSGGGAPTPGAITDSGPSMEVPPEPGADIGIPLGGPPMMPSGPRPRAPRPGAQPTRNRQQPSLPTTGFPGVPAMASRTASVDDPFNDMIEMYKGRGYTDAKTIQSIMSDPGYEAMPVKPSPLELRAKIASWRQSYTPPQGTQAPGGAANQQQYVSERMRSLMLQGMDQETARVQAVYEFNQQDQGQPQQQQGQQPSGYINRVPSPVNHLPAPAPVFAMMTQAANNEQVDETDVENEVELPGGIKCPECGSHTVYFTNDEESGEKAGFMCGRCRYEWTEKATEKSSNLNPKWANLEVGQTYKMTHPEIAVPDFVQVMDTDPLSVRLLASDEEALVDDEGYEFEPVTDMQLERDGSVRFTGGEAHPELAWLMEGNSSKDDEPLVDPKLAAKYAGRNYTPSQQQQLIDEPGEARNIGKLDLKGTHYSQEKIVQDLGLIIDPNADPTMVNDNEFELGL